MSQLRFGVSYGPEDDEWLDLTCVVPDPRGDHGGRWHLRLAPGGRLLLSAVPALELAIETRGPNFIELASWRSPLSAPPLHVPGANIKRRQMGREVYTKLHDSTDYALPKSLEDRARTSWDTQIAAEGKVPRRKREGRQPYIAAAINAETPG